MKKRNAVNDDEEIIRPLSEEEIEMSHELIRPMLRIRNRCINGCLELTFKAAAEIYIHENSITREDCLRELIAHVPLAQKQLYKIKQRDFDRALVALHPNGVSSGRLNKLIGAFQTLLYENGVRLDFYLSDPLYTRYKEDFLNKKSKR